MIRNIHQTMNHSLIMNHAMPPSRCSSLRIKAFLARRPQSHSSVPFASVCMIFIIDKSASLVHRICKGRHAASVVVFSFLCLGTKSHKSFTHFSPFIHPLIIYSLTYTQHALTDADNYVHTHSYCHSHTTVPMSTHSLTLCHE